MQCLLRWRKPALLKTGKACGIGEALRRIALRHAAGVSLTASVSCSKRDNVF